LQKYSQFGINKDEITINKRNLNNMKRIKSLILSIAMMLGAFAPMLLPVTVSAQSSSATQGGLCAGATFDPSVKDCSGVKSSDGKIKELLKSVIDIFSFVVGFIAVVMIIIGGVKYITSGGDSGNVTGAKNTILYAIIGLVVVALAQLIVRFTLSTTSSVLN
jgi:hypothetical protein